MRQMLPIIKLNVGGVDFTTTVDMIKKVMDEVPDQLFVDMDASIFNFLLNHARTDVLSIPKCVSVLWFQCT